MNLDAEVEYITDMEKVMSKESKAEGINSFQKYLSVWVLLCMAVGLLIGKFLPAIPALPFLFGAGRLLKLSHDIAAPAGMIGDSNFFELAVAVAIALFGTTSPAALATTVGVLTEVPVMLALCWFANKTRGWFQKWKRKK